MGGSTSRPEERQLHHPLPLIRIACMQRLDGRRGSRTVEIVQAVRRSTGLTDQGFTGEIGRFDMNGWTSGMLVADRQHGFIR